MRTYVFILFLVLTGFSSRSQPDSGNATRDFIGLRYENDFFSATDRYYTQGIRLTIPHSIFSKWPVMHLLYTSKKADVRQFGIVAEQLCFTPRSIRKDTIYFNERPYAAVMLLSHYVRSVNYAAKKITESKLDLGIMGPCALCEQEQKGLHRLLDNIQPLGWEYQLKTDVVVNYSLRNEKIFYSADHLNISHNQQLRLGTLMTHADAGLQTQIGRSTSLKDTITPQKKFNVFFSVSSGLRLVGCNATLQGGLFSNSVYTLPAKDITRLLIWANLEFTLRYKKLELEYFHRWITPEFTSGLPHAWGGINIFIYW